MSGTTKKKKAEKIYNSIKELKKDYFPSTFKKEQQAAKDEDKESFGAILALDILDGIRSDLAK